MKDVTNNFLETIEPVYTPGTINFDFDKFDAAIQAAVSELSDEQLDNLEYNDIKKEFTRFNSLLTKLDDKRKGISKVYKIPLNEFESNFKLSKEPLKELIDKLRAKRDEIDEHHRMLRIDHIRSVFEEKCKMAGLEKDTFKEKYDGYSLKKYFKDRKIELKTETIEEIDALILAEYDRLEEYKANFAMIEEQALDYELPAEPYTRALQNDTPLVEILKQMKKDRDAAIERKQQVEAKRKAESERLEEIEAIAKQSANEEIKAVNAETGEIIEESKPVEETPSKPIKPYKINLSLTFHGGEKQWHQFAKLLDDNFINYEFLGENK
ncbi:MAG: DUF1351 domain-containing protein [Streptococcus thermophilus]|jgi:hypothetical protein|uniref:DUF1351 domain-containing protein n=3 Tax=Aliceevansviridae TaxID=3044455 RepID=A0A3G8FCX3_9CAUD|nr:hypothetical protein PP200_gp33 [Streptococcus phage CHPC1045]YP_010681977.1 hypothetical protein PQE79_gp36 [Streptococcus phage CHPC1198]YP_010682568.1 hypothetical protein PQE91_gp44 [Streptococcus phage CHPC1246]AXF53694.1 hypothetical protein [Streptococcus phage 140]MDU7499572.1 DUF1351 domain-containing protein [Streptococcus thermophilus]AZF92180.1 hypothetical protein CHPC1246_0044 [Streptococcus phage CHPC1246]AZF92644.1 hypothetical protein CHPC1045_0034 [Streptococcus phage CHP